MTMLMRGLRGNMKGVIGKREAIPVNEILFFWGGGGDGGRRRRR